MTNYIKDKKSPFWKNALKVDHLLSTFTSVLVGNGKHTSFWKDLWTAGMNLKSYFPTLYWLCC